MKHLIAPMFLIAIAFGFQGCDSGEFDSPASTQSISDNNGSGTGTGTGGSMAKFTIAKDYLYIIQNDRLEVFALADAANPVHATGMKAGSDVETIFAFKEYLLMGTQTGMLIYSISNPAQPQYVSTYEHIRRCDPVVAEGKYAYVTLRTGSNCGGTLVNELHVIDISNMQSPQLVSAYTMFNPYGLGVDGNRLFVCDGTEGLKMFDCEYPENLQLVNEVKGMETYDVIPHDNLLMVIGPSGLSQYDYSDMNSLKLLSTIPITK